MIRIPALNEPLQSIRELLKVLFSEKHLYQSLTLNTDYIDELIKNSQDSIVLDQPSSSAFTPRDGGATRRALELKRIAQPWKLKAHEIEVGLVQSSDLLIPNIKTFCHQCSEKQPFKPLHISQNNSKKRDDKTSQKWLFSFICQSCQETQVDFLVIRDGLKLTICGRSPVETIAVPCYIPKKFRKYYSNAVIAANAGQVLAGLFLLRVFIEQFWHSIPEVSELVSKSGRVTGDEMGAAYKRTLPEDFKSRFPTLLEVYGELSVAMHTAREDAELFQSAGARVVEHFEARRLFKLNTIAS